MAHFYGEATDVSVSKDIKDLTFADKVVMILFGVLILAAVVQGFLGLWGTMVITCGLFFVWFDVIFHVLFHRSNKILYLFDAIGVAVMAAGLIVCFGRFDLLFAYAGVIYLIVCFGVGGFCLHLVSVKKKKIAAYSREVEAVCETVDVRRTNLFRFDDINSDPFASVNQNEIYKPGFHYYVDGEEYFTESTVYYGDLNTGYMDGNVVTLRVNPRNPAEVLPKNVGYGMELVMGISWIVIGFVTIVIGVVLGLFMFRI